MKKKITQITGIRGRDRSYLDGFVLEKNYEVCGKIKRNDTNWDLIGDHYHPGKNIKLILKKR